MSTTELQTLASIETTLKGLPRDYLPGDAVSTIPPPLPVAGGLVATLTEDGHTSNVMDATNEIPHQIKHHRLMTMNRPPRNKYRVYACSIWMFAAGFADAAPGALLPYIEQYYHLNYALSSLIWMAFAAGFIFIACLSHKIQPWLGKRYSMTLGAMLSTLMYAIVLSRTKYPVILVGFFFGGTGAAIILGQINVYLSKFENLSTYLSITQSLYGVGATISPLIATSFVSAGITWNYFYLILLGLMSPTAILFYFTYQGADEDLAPWDGDEVEVPSSHQPQEKETSHQLLILALNNKITWILSFFVFFYQGAEVSLAGWIVSYLLDYRHGHHSVGYVASGFWAGLTIGRLVVARPMHIMFGIRRTVIICSILSIIFVIITWVVPNIIAAAVFVSLAGVFVGPAYPLMITLSADLLPRKIIMISLTAVTAFGTSGGAIIPFIVGLLSQRPGTFVTLPVFIGLYSGVLVLWLLLPNRERMLKSQKQLTFWQKLW